MAVLEHGGDYAVSSQSDAGRVKRGQHASRGVLVKTDVTGAYGVDDRLSVGPGGAHRPNSSRN